MTNYTYPDLRQVIDSACRLSDLLYPLTAFGPCGEATPSDLQDTLLEIDREYNAFQAAVNAIPPVRMTRDEALEIEADRVLHIAQDLAGES